VSAFDQQQQEDAERIERELLDRHVQSIAELHALMDEMGVRHAVPERLQERLKHLPKLETV
jgi:hypothetical protein